ncbi:MAG: bis(5'-nucleosyl)-tetraphosphatase (symmetrical) YqeK [Candidatus Atribacteria bacterium]|jgi:predicted HD superfamily hydrolase involved in NAD metabolism|nr:bis(5'-nucleosyl)-tetraphosphatase (symmetrical) YqeK [Candidatus Atribacteria bacterium]
MKIDLMKLKLKNMLNEERWEHSVSTSQIAYDLAMKYGADPDKAKIAGLLHDCAKCMTFEKLKVMAAANKIQIDINMDKIPKVLHSFVGALIAEQEFNVQDSDILQAIRLHSTGGAKMSILDKVVYLSDKIEPLRYFNGITQVRQMAQKNLDKAVLMILDEGLLFLIKRGLLIYPATVEARNDILSKVVLIDA